jgi:4-hydroxy-2-oxoheptanedioate aldolase
MFRPNRTKKKLLDNSPAYGVLHSLAPPQVAEMIGLSGCDFVVIDGEHGMGSEAQHLACLQALASTPATPVLRVPSLDPVAVKRALDLGTEGVLVPDVRTCAQAEAIAGACFYPPRGQRGFSAGTLRAADYGFAVEDYVRSDGAQLLLCLMVESAEGVENIGEIAAVDGVDVIQVGPFDLSYDLGIPGQFDHPDFAHALKRIEAGTLAAGKQLGGLALPGLGIDELMERGYRMITIGADVPMLAGALRSAMDGTRN